jgi:hypothetical protein
MDYAKALTVLSRGGVEFILVDGAEATAHGSVRLTQDLDVVYRRDDANLQRLAEALAPNQPYLRGAPPGLPFHLDLSTLRQGLNFTLTTSLGDIDLLGEITGSGTYDDLVETSLWLELFGIRCRCIGLETLIRAKRAAGRPTDLEAIAELEAIRRLTDPSDRRPKS